MVLLPLQRYLYWSLGLHVGLSAVLLIAPSFFGRSHRFQQEKVVWVNVPFGTSDTIGSPLKKSEGLPKTTIQEQKDAMQSARSGQKKSSMTYTPPQSQKTAEKTPAAVPKREGQPKSRIDDALSRMQKKVAMKQAQPEAAQVPETQPGGFTFGSPTGTYVSPDDPEYVLYQAKIRKRVMDQWILPMKYADGGMGLICRIVVHMNERGEVVETEWEQKSGNPSFDLSAMRAVEKASPLDIPPERLKYEVYNEGFIIEFKPTAAQAATP
ncbi:MAG TPA: TonB C-terminal domain-containing protein [bacterium]|nr:TonB C-terminal domain-containing protein [bacterium]